MVPGKQSILTTLALVATLFLAACASKPFLKVQYQLPASPKALAGEEVALTITDIRKDAAFLTANAKKSLKNFNNTYSLVVLNNDGSGNLIGAYDLNSLLREIFRQRLENEGVKVAVSDEAGEMQLEIQLKEFSLDIVKRKWMLRMGYQAGLSKDTGPVARESVNGSAERLKVMGKSDAEKIMGELVSDMVNKLDVEKLFQQARQ